MLFRANKLSMFPVDIRQCLFYICVIWYLDLYLNFSGVLGSYTQAVPDQYEFRNPYTLMLPCKLRIYSDILVCFYLYNEKWIVCDLVKLI